jgi:isoleucyl-tRNA synthetase
MQRAMQRVPERSTWFDSGAMPVAQWHFPSKTKSLPPQFPADFICEAVDQTRGWFYSLHAISTCFSTGGLPNGLPGWC